MNKFQIVTNNRKDQDLIITKSIEKMIQDRGGSFYSCSYQSVFEDASQIHGDVECILVLGGDGTLLTIARIASEKNIPILGINLGTLGFLAEVDIPKIEDAIERLFNDDYICEERMMLAGKILDGEKSVVISPALNDIAITRCGSLQIIQYRIFVNHKFLCKLSADGVILSTPTGSTGYNMSAGGPIADPSAKMILLTPICAHTLNARSIILSSGDMVEVEIASGLDGADITVEASSDGHEKYLLNTGNRLCVTMAEPTVKIIKLNETSFLEALHRKMNEGNK